MGIRPGPNRGGEETNTPGAGPGCWCEASAGYRFFFFLPAFFAAFLAAFFVAFFAAFFLAAFLAGFFAAAFLVAFFLAAFLAGFFAGAFLAAFFLAAFLAGFFAGAGAADGFGVAGVIGAGAGSGSGGIGAGSIQPEPDQPISMSLSSDIVTSSGGISRRCTRRWCRGRPVPPSMVTKSADKMHFFAPSASGGAGAPMSQALDGPVESW